MSGTTCAMNGAKNPASSASRKPQPIIWRSGTEATDSVVNAGSGPSPDLVERMLRCPKCGNLIYPKIAPAVIVAVTRGDQILMTRYQGRDYKGYALIAGFTEIGETAEDTVRREVMEEVGLQVKDLRYYGSQPWGADANLLLGFFARLDGPSAIHLDRQELSQAGWYHRDEIDLPPDGVSLTNHMIQAFRRGEWD